MHVTCNVCQKLFWCENILKLHKNIHFHKGPYKCNICNGFFNNAYLFNNHLASHQCGCCKEMFGNDTEFRNHCLKSTLCNLFYNNLHNENVNGLFLHQRNQEDVQCILCKLSLKSFNNLRKHLITKHKSTKHNKILDILKQLSYCHDCKTTYKSYKNIYEHRCKSIEHLPSNTIVNGDIENNIQDVVDTAGTSQIGKINLPKTYDCPLCDDTEDNSHEYYERLYRFHTNDSHYMCLLHRSVLNNEHHQCETCNVSFNSIDELTNHNSIEHTSQQRNVPRTVKCSIHNGHLMNPDELLNHKIVQNGFKHYNDEPSTSQIITNNNELKHEHNENGKRSYSDPSTTQSATSGLNNKHQRYQTCDGSFNNSIDKLTEHTSQQRNVESVVKCSICNLMNSNELLNHKISALDHKNKYYELPRYFLNTDDESQNSQQQSSISELNNERYQCQTCNVSFNSIDELINHNFIEHTPQQCNVESTVKCSICNVNLMNSDELLNQHKYQYCTICKQIFSDEIGMKDHLEKQRFYTSNMDEASTSQLTTNQIDIQEMYDCPLCDVTFDTETEAWKHENEHYELLWGDMHKL